MLPHLDTHSVQPDVLVSGDNAAVSLYHIKPASLLDPLPVCSIVRCISS
jgi:hypothetical protein